MDVDLYRSGNSTSPRLDNVRDKDIVKWRDLKTDEVWVKGMSGGISTFTAPRPEQNWWWIRAGTIVPDGLTITRDRTDLKTGITHYTLRPAKDMAQKHPGCHEAAARARPGPWWTMDQPVNEVPMDWREINCLIEGLEALIEKYRTRLDATSIDQDERSDLSNDLSYAEILLASYRQKREALK